MSTAHQVGRGERIAGLVLGVAAVAVIGVVDVVTGAEVSVALFYLAPIAWLAWRGERAAAVALPIVAAITWGIADRLAGHAYSHPAMVWWNAGIRLGFFLTTGWLALRLRTALDRVAVLARTDGLTGALNAQTFRQVVEGAIAELRLGGASFSLAYLDLDDFKRVNDALGHEMGDRVLREVARAGAACLRPGDALGRLGGDEFAILLPGADRAAAEALVQAVADSLREAAAATGVCVTASTGVVSFSSPPASGTEALRLVDALMFEAKRGGKNRTRVGDASALPAAGASSGGLDDGG